MSREPSRAGACRPGPCRAVRRRGCGPVNVQCSFSTRLQQGRACKLSSLVTSSCSRALVRSPRRLVDRLCPTSSPRRRWRAGRAGCPAAQIEPRPGSARRRPPAAVDGDGEVRKDWLDTLRDDARRRLREAKIGVTGLGIANNAVQVRLAKPEDGRCCAEGAARHRSSRSATCCSASPAATSKSSARRRRRDHDHARPSPDCSSASPTPSAPPSRRCAGASTAMGTAEAQIVRQGSDRILVQVPGLQDTAELKELIGKTARLTFHEVHPTMSAEEAKQDARARRLQDLCRAPTGEEGESAAARDAGRARR